MCILLLLLFPDVRGDSLRSYLHQERILINHLFQDYRPDQPSTYSRVRADPRAKPKPQMANLTMMYGNLLSVNEPEQTMNIIVESFLEWTDYRLSWNSSEFNDIEVIVVTRNKVWIPDVIPYDAASYVEIVPADRQNVIIFSNGTVSLFISAIIAYNCELDMSDFPFDDQICAIKYSCYYSTNQELTINADFDSSFNYSQMSSNAWSVVDSAITYKEFHIAMHFWNYSEVNFLFTLRRSDTYYVVLIIIPAYVLTFLCIAGLFWSPITHDTFMEKLNLAYAGILAMVLILQMTTTEMPKTFQLPMLSLYTIINLASLTFASMVVLITGKYEMKLSKKSGSPRIRQLVRHIHLVFLVLFILLITVNLTVLVSRKGGTRAIPRE